MGSLRLLAALVAFGIVGGLAGAAVQSAQDGTQITALEAHIASMHAAGAMDAPMATVTPMPPMTH